MLRRSQLAVVTAFVALVLTALPAGAAEGAALDCIYVMGDRIVCIW